MKEERWEIVVMSDEPDEIIVNVLRDATLHIAETFGYDGRTPFDVAAFDPNGDCVSEYAHRPDEEDG